MSEETQNKLNELQMEKINEMLDKLKALYSSRPQFRMNRDGSMEGDPCEIVRFIEESIRMKERLKSDDIDLDKICPMVWGVKK